MFKKFFIFLLIFNSFNLSTNCMLRDTNVLEERREIMENDDFGTFAFESDSSIEKFLSGAEMNEFDNKLSLLDKISLIWEILKLKTGQTKDEIIIHLKENKWMYLSGLVTAGTAVGICYYATLKSYLLSLYS